MAQRHPADRRGVLSCSLLSGDGRALHEKDEISIHEIAEWLGRSSLPVRSPLRRITLTGFALLLGGCWVRHHPLESWPKGKSLVPATLADLAGSEQRRFDSMSACEGKDGRRFVAYHQQAGGLVYQFAYDAQSGKLVWFDEHPWEGTPCPCIDLML